MNRLSLQNGRIIASFKYSPTIVNAVRGILGRKFDKAKKQWDFPPESVVECVEVLRPLGFTVAPEVQALYRERQEALDDIQDIKRNDMPYTGSLPLYDFQRTGAAFLRALPAALLADVPGLGKTLQTFACFEDEPGQILILVPASLKFNWGDELKKWLPGEEKSCIVIHGDKQTRTQQWVKATKGLSGKPPPKWVIANYELLLHDFELMGTHPWAGVVCDEADRIKNPLAQTTKLVKALKAKKRIALTGTPVSNAPDDVWSIVDWLYPRYLGSFTQFQDRYCVSREEMNRGGQTYRRIMRYQNLDELRGKLEPIMLRRLKEDVLTDFPAKTVEKIRFDLSKGERSVYDSVRKSILEEIRAKTDLDTRSLGILPVKMLRLKQATDHLSLIDAHQGAYQTSTKLDTLKELLKPVIESGEKALVFTQFAEMSFILKDALKDMGVSVIWGGVDAQERKHIVDEFTADPQKKVLVMTEAGTYGLNLQAATYVFNYDLPWSVSKIEQREGRAHRVGQDKPVTVYHLIAKDSIDEHVLRLLEGKTKMAGQIMGDTQETISLEDMEEILGEKI